MRISGKDMQPCALRLGGSAFDLALTLVRFLVAFTVPPYTNGSAVLAMRSHSEPTISIAGQLPHFRHQSMVRTASGTLIQGVLQIWCELKRLFDGVSQSELATTH